MKLSEYNEGSLGINGMLDKVVDSRSGACSWPLMENEFEVSWAYERICGSSRGRGQRMQVEGTKKKSEQRREYEASSSSTRCRLWALLARGR